MAKRVLLAAVLLSLSGTAVYGAPMPVYELKGLTVTATRQAEDTQDVPAQVQIITEKEIKERNIPNAAAAVAAIAGVQAEDTIEGGVNLRGYTSKDILVLVDGQQMNSGWNGSVDWNMIPVENIRKIEVVSGGQSALYGGRAVGGVINIMTKSSKENGVHGAVNLGYGSHNTVKQGYNINGRKDKFTYGVFYESRSTDGWNSYLPAVVSGARQYPLSTVITDANGKKIMGERGNKAVMSESYGFSGGYDFDDDRKLTYKYLHSNYSWKYENPNSYVRDDSGKQLWPGIDFNDSPFSSFYGTRGGRTYDMHSLTYNDQKDKIHVHWGMTRYTKDGYTQPDYKKGSLDSDFNGGGKKTIYPSKNWNFDINKRWQINRHTILFGASYGEEQVDETIYTVISDWKKWNSKVTPNENDQKLGGKSKSWSLYAQDKWNVGDRWTAYIGGRYDHYKKYGGYSEYYNQEREEFASGSYYKFSPKLSVSYARDADTNIYLSFGKSFNPPLLYQVYRKSTRYGYLPNPDLEPETTDNWELGVKKKINGRTNFHGDVFYAKTKDFIDVYDLNEDESEYRNMGKATTKGVELAVDHSFSDKWSGYLNYTWQSGKVEGERNYDTPRHLFHTGLTYTNNPWTVHMDGTFISARNKPGVQSGHFKSADAHFLLNLNANYKVNENISVQLAVNNILDREYYDVEMATKHYYAGDGRNYMISAGYSF